MRNVLAAGWIALFVACKGGSGALPDEGSDEAEQGGGVQADKSSDRGAATETSPAPTATATTRPTTSQTISASEFNRTCETESDCALVYVGSTCNPCKCPNAAIASKDQDKYAQTFASRACTTPQTGGVACAPCSTQLIASCDATKTCVVGVLVDSTRQ